MAPQAKELVLRIGVLGPDHEDALEDLGQVSKIKCVVALGRGRQELARDALVDFDGGCHKRSRQWF